MAIKEHWDHIQLGCMTLAVKLLGGNSAKADKKPVL
jgi:hypothetical protein